ncbi:hypothetical protein BDY19DRAFT_993973 [Irpex rosettiformis]|uniref:Uncharacterized protein n=1 Tax=Irpex rosettiformis TaxID=378272 RepID=A0ACB8U316_9APHY|nr:hypothetical protein BDY19DRAFT_993973 [Irpex rosettiformis]
MKFLLPFITAIVSLSIVTATPVLWDGRAPLNLTVADLDSSIGPFLTVVKGSETASHYASLGGDSQIPTPLWTGSDTTPTEQVVSISIDNSSVFVPGGSQPQLGFRRTDFIAANNGVHDQTLFDSLETGVTEFHFSVKADTTRPLNFSHEYQVVWIEPNDGSHVFDLQIGSPFTNPTGQLPSPGAHDLKIRDHAGNVLFRTDFTSTSWHNFAVQVDWTSRSLAVLYSADNASLQVVTQPTPNLSATGGSAGQGDYHFGVLKLPLVNSADSPSNQNDVVHFGIQEGTTEALLYSGVFVENTSGGVSVGNGAVTNPF